MTAEESYKLIFLSDRVTPIDSRYEKFGIRHGEKYVVSDVFALPGSGQVFLHVSPLFEPDVDIIGQCEYFARIS